LRDCDVGIIDGKRFVKYVVEMGSGAIICTPNFIKIGSGIQQLFR
jgi:hypothetical protein